jgi:putative ABC transport system permease protein
MVKQPLPICSGKGEIAMTNMRFWLRWSWRDLRARWVQVVVIALIIAIGTGVCAGLWGQKKWRYDSADLSYGRLHMYDLRVDLASGSYLPQQEVLDNLQGIEGIQTMETRLISPTLVDATRDGKSILVRGRLIGVEVADGGPHVNGLYVPKGNGRTLTAADAGQNVAVIEYKFAKANDLKPGEPVRISGDVALNFVGAGHSPEYFIVMPETGSYFAEKNFAVVFVPLETAQRVTNHAGMVNDVSILLTKRADPDVVRTAIQDRMAQVFPDTGIEITKRQDDILYSNMYLDADSDQTLWTLVAFLFLIGAAAGAFNLTGRMIEAQRRQIGIGMALGVPRRWIAFRPLLVGFQVAVLGTIFGLLVGWGLGKAFSQNLENMLPLPFWRISFYWPGYILGTVLGILMPFAATLLPVWRAVRVAPVDAIQTGYMVAKGGGLSRLANRLPLPGKSFVHMPVKNVLRSPWRTLLTILGVAIAVLLMTASVGLGDTLSKTMNQADDAYRYRGQDRVLVTMDFFYPSGSEAITSITGLSQPDGQPFFKTTEISLSMEGSLSRGAEKIDNVLIELHDVAHAIWVPALKEGQLKAGQPGIVIAQKAAEDLGVDVGDTLTLKHPYREGPTTFRLVETEVLIIGIHNSPLRPLAYMDMSTANLMGLDGLANQIVVELTEAANLDTVKRTLLTRPGVGSVESISAFSDNVEQMLSMMNGVLSVCEIVVLIMALLIAFNSTSISVDERFRDIATMFAFGLPIRTVTRMQMLENFVIGVLGTVIGIIFGWLVLNAFMIEQEAEGHDLEMLITLYPSTLVLAASLGIAVVVLTPMLSIRRMKKMDIASTLRVVE